MKCPTEVAIADRREAELAKNGFMPLIYKKNSDFAAFIGAQSLQKPQEYDDPAATANANLAARLPYLFASLPLRALPEVHGARQDRLLHDQGQLRTGCRLAEPLRRLSPRQSSDEWKATHPLAEGCVELTPTSRTRATTSPSSSSSRTTSSRA